MKIWRALLTMYEYKQIDILDFMNKRQRLKLLEKYSKSEEVINKSSYLDLMNSSLMKKKFGKYIEMSTDTWTHLIFKEYLEKLPASIKTSYERIEHHQNKIQKLELEKVARSKRIEDLKVDADITKVQINNLDSSNLGLSRDISIEILEKFNSECARVEKKITDTNFELNHTTDEISKLESKLIEIQSEIEKNSMEILDLSEGSHIDVLYQEDFRGREQEIIEIYKNQSREASAAVEELIKLNNSGEVITKNKANTIRGSLPRVKVFEKSYKLVPSDPDLRREFEKNFKYVSGDAKYEAKIDGEGYRLIKCKSSGDGRKVAYYFELQFDCRWYHYILLWKSPQMPWIKITHEIPNTDYNEAALINKIAVVNQLKKKHDETCIELVGIDGEKGKLIKKHNLELKLNELKLKKEENDEQIKLMLAAYYVQFLKRRLDEICKEIEQLTKSTEIEDDIESNKHEIVQEEDRLRNTRKTKKYFAIIIKEQIGTARLIRELPYSITPSEELQNMDTNDKTRNAWCEFIEVFDENIDKIEIQVEQDLSL